MEKENSDVVIRIENLCKDYKMFSRKKDRLLETILPRYEKHGVFSANKDINLEVKKGEVLGILGKNGAGKSTLLKMVTGVVVPTSGTITINGKVSSLLELGTAFNPELTGYDNIYQHGQVMGLTNKEIKEKEQEIIDFADIGDHLYQPVKTYSSGMFARLAFACAINVDPEVLIVDEVLSVGDMAFQLKCFKKFEQFKKSGKTILFVSHDLSSIIKYCDRSLLIHQGKQIAVGKSSEIVDIYKKILVNQYDEEEKEKDSVEAEVVNKEQQVNEAQDEAWKSYMVNNPNAVEYGNGVANIIDYAVVDEHGNIAPSIHKGSEFTIKMKVEFYQPVDQPIFAYTLKDIKGTEITGTNTMLEGQTLEHVEAGQVVTVAFKQKMCLQGANYLIALGCTGYVAGEFTVYSRLYDVCNLQVISDKNTIGYVDMAAEISYL